MRLPNIPIILLLVTLALSSCKIGPYSTLKKITHQLPGDTAEVFAPGIISTENYEFAITFSPAMDEIFFTRRQPDKDNEIFTLKFADGKWSDPEPAFFSTPSGWDFEPHISPDGKLLYFGSTRPLPDSSASPGMHQWVCRHTFDGWSQPVPLGSPFEERFVMYLTSSAQGNLYFTGLEPDAPIEDGGIYFSEKLDGQSPEEIRMGAEINSPGKWIAHSFIAPDESYLIFDAKRPDGFGKSDLYISFKVNGTWTKAQNMGPKINSPETEMCGSVSPDGKYLFFHRGGEEKGEIYWIDFAGVKKGLKRKAIENRK